MTHVPSSGIMPSSSKPLPSTINAHQHTSQHYSQRQTTTPFHGRQLLFGSRHADVQVTMGAVWGRRLGDRGGMAPHGSLLYNHKPLAYPHNPRLPISFSSLHVISKRSLNGSHWIAN